MIVTAATNQVIVDIHDRRPLVILANAVPEWLSPDTSPSRAQDLVRRDALRVSAFSWHPLYTGFLAPSLDRSFLMTTKNGFDGEAGFEVFFR